MIFYNLTGMAHIDPNEYPQHLLGIRSAVDGELRTDVQGQIYPPLANDWTSIASKGGITIALSEKGDDEAIPVYYYMYDDKNEPTGEVKTDSYTPADTGFVPKQDYGIPIADESLSNTDKSLVSKQGKQMYFYYKEYPDLAANVVDYKGTSAESEWRNPKAITTPIKTSKTVSGTETKAKSIHVKVIQPPSVQVVYHVYNYVVPDEDYDSIKGLTGSALENAVKDLTPTVSSSNKSIVLSETNKSYKASTDTTAKSYGTPIHVTATLAGKEAALADAHCPDYCEPGERNWITSASSPKVYKPNGSAVFRADPTTVVNFNDEATGTGTRQIHVKIINVKQAPPLGESAKDRIKTYDVTQLIEDTQQTVSVKPTFSEHRFSNEFPNENTPEITQISGISYVFVKRTFFEQYNNLLLHLYDLLINAPADNFWKLICKVLIAYHDNISVKNTKGGFRMTNTEIQAFLVETIITRPMQEYSDCVKRLIRNPDDRGAKARITEIEGFFLSEPFRALTHANGTEVIKAIHEKLEKQGFIISGLIDGKEHNDVQ